MIRAVLDTTTIVSGIGWRGAPARVMDAAVSGAFVLVSSPALLEELRRVLEYPKLARVIENGAVIVEAIALLAEVVEPGEKIDVLDDDPDNRVLEAAIAGGAGHVVTGDKGMLRLKAYRDVSIVTAAEFLPVVGWRGDA